MKNREWNPPSHRFGATRMKDGELMVGSARCADRSSQRDDPTRTAARRGLRALPLRLALQLVVGCSMLVVGCFHLAAQSYSIDWYKIAGGGGTSSNGQYTVSGTIGQHDAGGPMTGGNYSLTGGFWALISVVQTPGAPTLYISHAGNTVLVYWQAVSGWTNLEQNSSLSASLGWTTNTDWTFANGTNSLSLTAPTGNLFFRLTQ